MKYIFFFVFLLVYPAFALGQEDLLGPRDVIGLTIYVAEKPYLSQELTVDSQGRLAVPMVGSLMVEGMTLPELEQAIVKPLAADYFVNPQVILTVKQSRSLAFVITGAVSNPGKYEMEEAPTLMELIGRAGGLAADYGQIAYVTHEGEDETGLSEIDIIALLESGGNTGNLLLKKGDRVQIPFKKEQDQSKSNIFLSGEVKKPGMYPYQPGLTALNACVMAGGFNDFAAPNRSRILRRQGGQQEVLRINLERVKRGQIEDILLQPGDHLHVPETWL